MSETNNNKKIEWIISNHRDTNHYYGEYIPYEFHLRMVAQVSMDFRHLLELKDSELETVTLAAYGHDLIEDTRVSYNDVKNMLGEEAADIIYALTNEKGKNRKERANSKYYEGIRNTPNAVFVKLCDRIANVQYSKMIGSRMTEMYYKENPEFIKNLGFSEELENPLNPMFNYLINLFETK